MPAPCVVNWCTNVQSKTDNKNISFHRLPLKKPHLLNRWLLNMNILKYTKTSVVCSDHFKAADFREHANKKLLHENAVPVSSLCKTPPRDLQPLQMQCTDNNYPMTSGNLLPKIKARRLNFSENDNETHSEMHQEEHHSGSEIISVKTIQTEHSYAFPSPKKARSKTDCMITKLNKYSRKCYNYAKQVQKLKQQLLKKSTIVKHLQSQLKNCKCKVLGNGKFSNVLKEIVNIEAKGVKPKQYSQTLKMFAVSMNFYSAHAYNYLRQQFTLPHPRTIRNWASTINGNAGFTMETIKQIGIEVQKSSHKTYATLMFDEMAIKRQLDFDGKEIIGHCNFDSTSVAREVLQFYCKGLNASWKFPVGYFVSAGVDSERKTLLLMAYVKKLEETGVRIVALTCDGTSTNLSVLNNFGIETNASPNCSFTYSHENNGEYQTSGKIRGILDPCHMLKLFRNLLSDVGFIYDGEGNAIRWDYIVRLHQIQKNEGLYCANKLQDKHIDFGNQKMKVNLAAQTLSNSVANALLFLRDTLRLPEFKDVGPTVTFIQFVDRTFDILNSVDVWAKGSKAPITKYNEASTKNNLNEAITYFSKLRLGNGSLICESRRKVPVVGFILNCYSVLSLAEELVWSENPPLRYLLCRNLSQDHVEKFFSCIRKRTGASANGWFDCLNGGYGR